MPYRVGQSTGHLLGPISLLLPALLLALERRRLVVAGLVLVALPLSGQLHLALGAIPLALGYAWARLPRPCGGRWQPEGLAALAAGLVVQRWAVAGSIGTGRSFAQVERYSAELSDLVTRGVGDGVEELVFVGWLVPVLALVGLWSVRRQRGLALVLGLGALLPILLAFGGSLPGYELLWRVTPGLGSTRVPERLMPIACLALAASRRVWPSMPRWRGSRRGATRPSPWWAVGLTSAALGWWSPSTCACRCSARWRPTPRAPRMPRSTRPAGCSSCPSSGPTSTTAPSISATHGRARASGRRGTRRSRSRPPTAGHGRTAASRAATAPSPAWVAWVVVHRGVYAQTGFFAGDCPARAESMLARTGWQRVRRDGVLTTWRRAPG